MSPHCIPFEANNMLERNKQETLLSKHCVHEVDVEVTANGIVDESLLRLHLLSLVAEHHIIIPPTPSFDACVPTSS